MISTNLCRYTPPIETLANSVISDKVDSDSYGSVFIPNNYDGSLGQRSKVTAATAAIRKGGKAGGKNEGTDERTQPKLIFFIIGGISYTEVRVINELAKNNPQFNVMAGSTSLIKPTDYITGISKMLSKAEYEDLKIKSKD